MGIALHLVDGDWQALGNALSELAGTCSVMVASRDPKQKMVREVPGAISAQAAEDAANRYADHCHRFGQSLQEYSQTAMETDRLFANGDQEFATRFERLNSRVPGRLGSDSLIASHPTTRDPEAWAKLVKRLGGG